MHRSLRDGPLKLEKVIGSTSLNAAGLVGSSTGTDFFYIAGCVVVQYNHTYQIQKSFYSSSKPISCIALSQDGRYLAAGERGHMPDILIWDILKEERVMTLSSHKSGVGSINFSPDSKYLVSAGFKHDKQLIVWDWVTGKKLCTQRISNKVLSLCFHHSGDFFITAGDRHLKWWRITEVLEGEAIALEGSPASITEDYRNAVFTDVVCGSWSCEGKVYCTTNAGVLTIFNADRMVEKCVQLNTTPAYSLEVFTAEGASGLLVIGCGNGDIYTYSPATLELIILLPRPHTLTTNSSIYPACYAVRKLPGSRTNPVPKLATVYADHSIYIWDITDIENVTILSSLLSHRSCVWDMQFLDLNHTLTNVPHNAFFTCSADNSVRCWNLDKNTQSGTYGTSAVWKELVHTIDIEQDPGLDQNTSFLRDSRSLLASTASALSMTQQHLGGPVQEFNYSTGIPDLELPDRPQSVYSPRSLAIHPYLHQLACGDKTGHLRIYDLHSMQLVRSVQAHAAEILSLAYSPPLVKIEDHDNHPVYSVQTEQDRVESNSIVLLATGGRDRLIHVFNAQSNYSPVDTLDYHSSSVTVVKFTHDGKKLISCGGDKTMVFYSVNGPLITRMKTMQTTTGTINGLAIDPSNKFAVSSGQDKRLNIWNINTGKLMRAYKNAEINSELYKCDLDPSGSYIATCGFDKHITLVDFFSGESIGQVSGHSELVTGVKFAQDGIHLVSIGGDGCIMVWKLGQVLVKAMRDRLTELYSSAQKKNSRAVVRQQQSLQGSHTDDILVPKQSLSNLKQKLSARSSAVSASNSSVPTEGGEEAGGREGGKKNKWQSKVDSGYELFGRKVAPGQADPHHNKFTLELTSPVVERTLPRPPLPSSPPVLPPPVPTEEEQAEAAMCSSPTKLAAEEGDGVRQSLSSDDEEGEGMFVGGVEIEEESNISIMPKRSEEVQRDEEEEKLLQVEEKIGILTRSAQDIENWLEEMLKKESEAALPPLQPVEGEAGDVSLSSVFFKENQQKKIPAEERGQASAPSTPSSSAPLPLPSEEQSNEKKLRESAAMMAQMRERLRAMDALDPPLPLSLSSTLPSRSSPSPHSSPAPALAFPPPPPSKEEEEGEQGEEGEKIIERREEEGVEGVEGREAVDMLKEKTASYYTILRELEEVKSRAASSLQELLQIKSSLEQSLHTSSSLLPPTDQSPSILSLPPLPPHATRQSLQTTDELVQLFRSSLSSFQDLPLLQSLSRSQAEQTFQSSLSDQSLTQQTNRTGYLSVKESEDMAIAQFLEKYSDKLVEIVGEKILSKVK